MQRRTRRKSPPDLWLWTTASRCTDAEFRCRLRTRKTSSSEKSGFVVVLLCCWLLSSARKILKLTCRRDAELGTPVRGVAAWCHARVARTGVVQSRARCAFAKTKYYDNTRCAWWITGCPWRQSRNSSYPKIDLFV